MLKELRPAIVLVIAMTVITGLAYPLAMTGVAGALFPAQASGSTCTPACSATTLWPWTAWSRRTMAVKSRSLHCSRSFEVTVRIM